ncbi:MAG: DNRLRE domain-containing protein [Kofleriaceae bacterium]|nr:DNRLRE domain-containing protein [Kofleriaceae bacterium]
MRSGAMRAALFAVSIAGGCYNPTPVPLTPCDTTDQCPGTLECIDHRCGGTPNDAAPDAFVPDGTMLAHVVIGTSAGDVRDTELADYDPSKNFASDNHTSVDSGESSLIWFDIEAHIPTTKTVSSATLTVTVADEADEAGGTVEIHRLKESWVETEVTWISRNAQIGWLAAGALPPMSSDATPMATFRPDGIGKTIDISLPVAVVQGWVTMPGSNHGIIIVRGTSQEHVHLNSHDSAGPWSKLTIDYY